MFRIVDKVIDDKFETRPSDLSMIKMLLVAIYIFLATGGMAEVETSCSLPDAPCLSNADCCSERCDAENKLCLVDWWTRSARASAEPGPALSQSKDDRTFESWQFKGALTDFNDNPSKNSKSHRNVRMFSHRLRSVASCLRVHDACKSDYECCSFSCDTSSGVCIPYVSAKSSGPPKRNRSTTNPSGNLWKLPSAGSSASITSLNAECIRNRLKCLTDEDCCSKHCSRRDGLCHRGRGRSANKTGSSLTCRSTDSSCRQNNDCCSEFCNPASNSCSSFEHYLTAFEKFTRPTDRDVQGEFFWDDREMRERQWTELLDELRIDLKGLEKREKRNAAVYGRLLTIDRELRRELIGEKKLLRGLVSKWRLWDMAFKRR